MKFLSLLLLIHSLLCARPKDQIILHYRDGSIIKEHMENIDSISFGTSSDTIIVDSFSFLLSSGPLPPEYDYCKTYLMRPDSFTYKIYNSAIEKEDSLHATIEDIRRQAPYFKDLAPILEKPCIKSMNIDFSDYDMIGGGWIILTIFYNDGTITHLLHNHANSEYIPMVLMDLFKTIEEELFIKID